MCIRDRYTIYFLTFKTNYLLFHLYCNVWWSPYFIKNVFLSYTGIFRVKLSFFLSYWALWQQYLSTFFVHDLVLKKIPLLMPHYRIKDVVNFRYTKLIVGKQPNNINQWEYNDKHNIFVSNAHFIQYILVCKPNKYTEIEKVLF